jgi:hypothetical protein
MPQTVVYPDGSILSTSELSHHEVEILFQALTCGMLGITVNPLAIALNLTTGQFAATAVSLNGIYEGQGISGPGIPAQTFVSGIDTLQNSILLTNPATMTGSSNVSIIDPDAYGKVRVDWQTQGQPGWDVTDDIAFLHATEKDDEYNRIREQELTVNDAPFTVNEVSTWTKCWQLSWEIWGPNANRRGNLIRNGLLLDWTASSLASSRLYVVPDIAKVDRVPQKFQGQWWEVAYLRCDFYEDVTQTLSTPTGNSVEIIVSDKSGVLIDRTIQA